MEPLEAQPGLFDRGVGRMPVPHFQQDFVDLGLVFTGEHPLFERPADFRGDIRIVENVVDDLFALLFAHGSRGVLGFVLPADSYCFCVSVKVSV